jgi:hypothetical protein
MGVNQMKRIKKGLDNFMDEVKMDNPEANWGNLLTGVSILIVIAMFSIWYFGNPSAEMGSFLSEIINTGKEEIAEAIMDENVTVVEAGEGLWHVAERVCGNPEVYNFVAEENGLSVWDWVYEGRELTVTCDY